MGKTIEVVKRQTVKLPQQTGETNFVVVTFAEAAIALRMIPKKI
jgi:hypothetical protein